MKELKKNEELKIEADKLQNEIDNIKMEIKFRDRNISQLRIITKLSTLSNNLKEESEELPF